jgi:hypothetical protein
MVHRTDIARGSLGQVSPDDDRVCRRALKWPLLENNRLPGPLPASRLPASAGGMKDCYRPAAVVPAVHAIHFELATP